MDKTNLCIYKLTALLEYLNHFVVLNFHTGISILHTKLILRMIKIK